MAQDLFTYDDAEIEATEEKVRQRVDRSTASAVAAAVAALAVATLVVSTSSRALVSVSASNGTDLKAGTITITDDDRGRSLVDLGNMAPGRPVTQCINIAYTGSILPVELTMTTEVEGDIAEFVDVDVETGFDGGFGACDGFRSDGSIFDGRLDAMVEPDLSLGDIRIDGEQRSFRFTFDLADDAAAAGRSGTVDFVWEAEPS